MALRLTNFRIRSLHGRTTIDIPIDDNKLILVGENGSGKTTIINLLYFLLSRQWFRLARYRFAEISATIDNQEIRVFSQDMRSTRTLSRLEKKWGAAISPVKLARLKRYAKQFIGTRPPEFVVADVAEDLDIPFELVRFALSREYLMDDQPTLFEETDALSEVEKKIKTLVRQQVLYLPTYRRIEQDLKSIFPGIDFDEMARRKEMHLRHGDRSYIELVEFGMEDVDQRIAVKMGALKESVRSKLNNLTGTYLKEVISGEYTSVDMGSLEELRASAIEPVLNRIGEDLLPEAEKDRLRKILGDIERRRSVEEEHRVIAHFLLKLLDLHKAQQKEEQNVRAFADACNRYLGGKRLVYDSNEFRIDISLTNQGSSPDGQQSIQMRQLSSGEKQIVSLFSHLFLSGTPEFLVLIDEPELSLSVPWQKTFLPDIAATQGCAGLVAVTHSPFVFDNAMDQYAHSVAEFVS